MPNGQQQVIGADNQHGFIVFKDSKKNIVMVYYGLNFYDSAPLDKNSFEFKHMLGKLYVAGIKVKTLIDNFGFSYPTYQRWGEAIRSGDEERIYCAFSGQGGKHKKLTAEIIAFITHSFKYVYKRNKYSYSKEIRQDVKDVFGVRLTSECIRPLLGKLKEFFKENSGLSEAEKKRIYKSFLS